MKVSVLPNASRRLSHPLHNLNTALPYFLHIYHLDFSLGKQSSSACRTLELAILMNQAPQQEEISMKKTVLVLALGLLMIASASCFHALAEPLGPPPGPPPGGEFFGGPPGPPLEPPPCGGGLFGLWGGPPDLIEKLKLTDDQLKHMLLAYADFKDRTRKARKALMGLHDEKETMVISGKIDQSKLAKLDEETTKLASEVMGEELKMKREYLSKLTPEQVERLAEFLSKRKIPHRRKMMGR